MVVNELKFGNINKEQAFYFNQASFLDTLLEELKSHPYPENSSDTTQQELQTLVSFINITDKDIELQQRYIAYDTDLEGYLISLLKNTEIPESEVQSVLSDIYNDVTPLLMKIKYHYQRIRPFQMAYYSQSGLCPFKSISNSPSYPSGHAFYSRLYCEVLGNKYPQYFKQLDGMANDIGWSRLYIASNFPTDSEFGVYMADAVLSNPEFKKKYRL